MNQVQAKGVPLAVGLTLGLLALVVGVLVYLYRRRGRTPIQLNVRFVSPYTNPSMGRVDEQSSVPQYGKRPPHPARLPSAPMATGDLIAWSSGSVLGPPPSYETPMNDWRVGMTQ